MTIQSSLNAETINFFSAIKFEIKSAERFEANQMNYATLQACNNAHKAINTMTKTELEIFESDLIETFKFKNWIK